MAELEIDEGAPKADSRAEKKQLELLNAITHEAIRHKDTQVGDRWKTVDKYARGLQSRFEGSEPDSDDWRSDARTNLLAPFYGSVLAVLMRDIPQVDASGVDPMHEQLAKEDAKITTRDMRRNEFVERTEELLFSVVHYGMGALKTTWDARIGRGIGGIRHDAISAKNLLKQPGKVRMRDSHYIIEMTAVSKLDLLMMYPEKKNQIHTLFADRTKAAEFEQLLNLIESDTGTHIDGTGLTIYHDARMGGATSTQKIVLYEAWMRDPETIERFGWIIEPSDSGVKPQKRKRSYAKYPTGRYIRWAGDVKFEDRENPFPDFPYSEMIYMSDDLEWPMGGMDQLIPIQDLYDLRNNQLNDSMNFAVMGDQTWMDARTGVKSARQITNRPGEVRFVASIDGIKTTPGPRVPGEAFASINQILADFDRVSGSPDILPQLSSGDWRSGYAVDALSELVRGRLKLLTYSQEACMRDFAQKNTRMHGMFYERGVHYPQEMDLVGVHPEMFEYTIRAGLNLPASRRAQEQFLLQMLDRAGPVGSGPHAVMYQYTLSQTDLPNKDALLDEMKAAREQDMKQAQAAQQAQQEADLQAEAMKNQPEPVPPGSVQ